MSDADNAFTQATDDLIALYRSIERSTLDLPLFSFMPLLVCLWSYLKLFFFLIAGFLLIIPVNLVILIRNCFPGHWRYRPFFLSHLYYVWLWVWRGEAPTVPLIFIRPLMNIFVKEHFGRRLRRLRLEILLRDELSDATRSTLLARLDVALQRWKTPRFNTIFINVLVPGIISFPTWYKQFIDFLGSAGIHMPTDVVGNVISSMSPGQLTIYGSNGLGYLMALPITNFLAKRGLFLGCKPNRICFPGGQGGPGAYLKEKEILGNLGLHAREPPIDLWLIGIGGILGWLFVLSYWDSYVEWIRSLNAAMISSYNLDSELQGQFESALQSSLNIGIAIGVVLLCLAVVAALRRGKTGRT
jgi:hypothetical protein